MSSKSSEGHPVREHILAVLNERIASAREIGDELGADVSSFYHHVEELEKLDCIERVATRRRRGANEHFFRAKKTVFFDDVVDALSEGTFDAREDRHASWTPGFFDARGWDEAMELMSDTVAQLVTIREAAASRLAETDERGIPATMAILAFETPSSGAA